MVVVHYAWAAGPLFERAPMRQLTIVVCSLSMVAALGACGETSYTITPQPLQGKINGEAFTFGFGATNSFLDDPDSFFATMFQGAAPTDPCGFSSSGGAGHVIAGVPRTPGEYPMSLQRNITLAYGGSNNQIITDGLIRVDSVTATEVKGGLFADGGDKFTVDGEFTLKICAP